MASYKVPQDVEADDKLIGPFSFRQFIYLIIVAGCVALAWGLSQVFIALAIIPLPVIIFFGALALPLRKDQPMEIYMAAMVSFYLKPRQRGWDPEGVESLIEISAPKVIEYQRTKDLSQNEAQARLSYLANIVDSGGWAIRGVNGPGSSLNNDIVLEAQSATDILDTNTSVAHKFDQMMSQSTNRVHEEAKARMVEAAHPQPPAPAPVQPRTTPVVQPAEPIQTTPQAAPQQQSDAALLQAAQALAQQSTPIPQDLSNVHFDPYPTFKQSIIQPLNDEAHRADSDIEPVTTKSSDKVVAKTDATPEKKQEKEKATSDTQLTADIMNLANNPDLSIETIARQAKRIHEKAEDESDEVIISLR